MAKGYILMLLDHMKEEIASRVSQGYKIGKTNTMQYKLQESIYPESDLKPNNYRKEVSVGPGRK
jgi:hypothetical protein